jgi:cytochrome d ubiquinol oxidase subunit II
MSTAAFGVIAFMLAAYVLLDGYDLGIGAVAWLIGRDERERNAAMASIGPFWNGNEVWLIASGGALFALFPTAYASAFSGFYLPFIVLLWLLMFRGIALELRDHFPSQLWREFWDAAFSASSALLILVFGIAFGNLVRGLPLDAAGYFRGTFAFLLNPYALLVGAFALAVLALHGAAFAYMRIDGPPGVRARALAEKLVFVVVILFGWVSLATFQVRSFPAFGPILPASICSGALVAAILNLRQGNAIRAFVATSALVVALVATGAGTLYPYLLPAFPAGRAGGITIFDAAPSPTALTCALVVTIGGSIAVLAYSSLVWRRMGGKVRVESGAE